MFMAAKKGHIQVAKLLLSRGADVAHQTKVRLSYWGPSNTLVNCITCYVQLHTSTHSTKINTMHFYVTRLPQVSKYAHACTLDSEPTSVYTECFVMYGYHPPQLMVSDAQ